MEVHNVSRRVVPGVLIIGFSAFAIAMRLVDHAPNFTPVGGLVLFSGVYLSRRWSWLVPVGAMIASDFLIGFYDWRIMTSVYGSFLAMWGIGLLVRRDISLSSVLAGSLSGSLLFYFVTNFAVWLFSGIYPLTSEGLLLSYTLALPFFRNTLAGDLFYTAVFFGAYVLVMNALPLFARARAQELFAAMRVGTS